VIVGTIACLALAVVGRVMVSGPAALERGDAALAAGDHLGASQSWREAVSWVLPVGASWREEAMERLDSLSVDRVSAGDLSGAVMALSSLRSGILAGHGLLRPDSDRLVDIDVRLADLLAQWEAQDAQRHGRTIAQDREARVALYAGRLAADPRPDRAMSFLSMLGFIVWIVSALKAAGLESASRRRWWVLAVLGVSAMLAGVAFA